jgi:hypothetical protein
VCAIAHRVVKQIVRLQVLVECREGSVAGGHKGQEERMTTVRTMGLAALCAVAACTTDPANQVITGRVDPAKGPLAIRAIADDDVVAAAPVRTDGSFTLALPAGNRYRLEVLTRSGRKNLVTRSGGVVRDLTFAVCQPVDPFDCGDVGDPPPGCMDPSCMPPSCDPMLDPDCKCLPDGTCCSAMDPNCAPPPCMDPSCGGCQPGDPSCCDPMTDPDCQGTCSDPMDPTCGSCPPPPCSDPMDPGCVPPCDNPMDPTTCKDPCLDDPMACGCPMDDPSCWPAPQPCDGTSGEMCDPGDGMTPAHVPTDFGCQAGM